MGVGLPGGELIPPYLQRVADTCAELVAQAREDLPLGTTEQPRLLRATHTHPSGNGAHSTAHVSISGDSRVMAGRVN